MNNDNDAAAFLPSLLFYQSFGKPFQKNLKNNNYKILICTGCTVKSRRFEAENEYKYEIFLIQSKLSLRTPL